MTHKCNAEKKDFIYWMNVHGAVVSGGGGGGGSGCGGSDGSYDGDGKCFFSDCFGTVLLVCLAMGSHSYISIVAIQKQM